MQVFTSQHLKPKNTSKLMFSQINFILFSVQIYDITDISFFLSLLHFQFKRLITCQLLWDKQKPLVALPTRLKQITIEIEQKFSVEHFNNSSSYMIFQFWMKRKKTFTWSLLFFYSLELKRRKSYTSNTCLKWPLLTCLIIPLLCVVTITTAVIGSPNRNKDWFALMKRTILMIFLQ